MERRGREQITKEGLSKWESKRNGWKRCWERCQYLLNLHRTLWWMYFFLTCLFPYQAFQKHGPHLIYYVFLQSLLLCLVCGTFLVNVGFLIIKIIGCEIGEESLKKFYFPGNRGMVLIRHKRRTISDFQEVKSVFWPDWWDNYDAEIVRTDLSF